VRTLYDALRAKASTESPWLGISVLELDWRLRQKLGKSPRTGIYIDDVYEPSPASRAGIQPGDVLVSMGGQRLLTVSDFQRWLYLFGIDAAIEVEVWRDGKTGTHTLKIEQRPAAAVPR
jgi:S1-C subfamily serine protease